MSSSPLSPVVERAFDRADTALAGVAGLELDPSGIDEANACLRRIEQLRRSVEATLAGLVVAAESSVVFAGDGHRNATTWTTRVNRLSREEARRRVRIARTVRDLPAVRKAFEAGRIGTDQVEAIAKILRNPRIRSQVLAFDEDLAVIAAGLTHAELVVKLKQWEQLMDADGAGSFRRHHRDRNARFTSDYDGGSHLRANQGSVDGAEMRTIFDHHLQDELDADWAEARERLGDEATWSDLRRTDAQRRADALLQIFRNANAHRGNQPGKSSVETVIVMGAPTAEDAVDHLAPDDCADTPNTHGHPDPAHADSPGDAAAPQTEPGSSAHPGTDDQRRPARSDSHGAPPAPPLTLDPDPAGVNGRASTLDGHPVDPRDALRRSLHHSIRIAVIDRRGVCINLGRSQRFYKGPAQKAARLSHQRCEGAGCDKPATHTQTDHMISWTNGGPTDQENAACLCGYHNRLKEQGFTMTRGPDGRARWFRPDGTEIE